MNPLAIVRHDASSGRSNLCFIFVFAAFSTALKIEGHRFD